MMANLRGKTDDELAEFAGGQVYGPAATVEGMRRLRVAIEALTTESSTYSRWMFRLTIVIAANSKKVYELAHTTIVFKSR